MTDYSSLHAKEATLVAASLFLLSDARSDDAQTDTYMIHYIVGYGQEPFTLPRYVL